MADVWQQAMLRRRQDAEHQDFHLIIEYMNEMQKGLMVTMERKQKSMREPAKNFGRSSVRA